MKVILTPDVDKLGKSGELKDVAEGYARNFLLARKLAVPADRRRLSSVAARHRQPRGQAQARARGGGDCRERIASTTLTMGVKVGEGGKLYGSITAKDIADALERRGIVVDRHKIDLDEPLKMLGTYKVAVKVFPGMTPEVTIAVEPKG